MSFVDDIKIGRKLVAGFLIVLLILIIIAALGYTNMAAMSANSASMYNDRVVRIDQLGRVAADMQQMRAEIYRYIYVPESRADLEQTTIPALRAEIKNEMDAYRATSLLAEETSNLSRFDAAYADWNREYDRTIAAAKAGDKATYEAQLKAGSPLINARTDVVSSYKAMLDINIKEAALLNSRSSALAASGSLIMIIATIIAVIAGIVIALYLSRSITGPVDNVSRNLREMSLGHLSNRMKMSRKDEIGEMAKTMDEFSEFLQKDVVGSLIEVSKCNLDLDLTVKDEKDEITPIIIQTVKSLDDVMNEVTTLTDGVKEGRLDYRGNPEKFVGCYRDIITGINNTLDAFAGPVNDAMRVSNEYAKGNFTARFDEKLDARGDFLKFRDALNNIGIEVSKSLSVVHQQVGDLAASAEEANASVEEVAAGSAQVAKNASAVSINAEKTTDGIEQVQKAMEDLSRTIQDVATKAEVVAKIVQDTTTFSREGMELARKTEKGMQGITKSSADVNQIILEIKGQMDKISEIVSLITDLANQTNLLALNAAIEAARAGDAGRGFAVVATEVKSLAVESRASAERISGMIDNLQKQTLSAVDAVTAANAGVKEGSAAMQETLSSFSKIAGSIDKISQNVSEVAAAAEEQAASVEEVTASVNEVNALMQSTTREATDAAAASEESSAAIDQITKVVANVNTIVDKVTKEIARFRV